jgi:hypothetical protein
VRNGMDPNPAPSNSVTSQRRIAGSLSAIIEFEKFSGICH